MRIWITIIRHGGLGREVQESCVLSQFVIIIALCNTCRIL